MTATRRLLIFSCPHDARGGGDVIVCVGGAPAVNLAIERATKQRKSTESASTSLPLPPVICFSQKSNSLSKMPFLFYARLKFILCQSHLSFFTFF